MKNDIQDTVGRIGQYVPRITPALRGILEIFENSPGPVSVPDLIEKLSKRKCRVNKTTVYRKLETLKSIGMIEEVLLSGAKRYYELSRDHHHHLICLSCEKVEDWHPNESVLSGEQASLKKKGFQVLRHSLELFGRCRECSLEKNICL